MKMTHHRACNLCEAICGLVIETENNKVLTIRGDELDPLSKGYVCPKAFALKDINDDPNRLRLPQKRTVDGWQTVSWDTAFAEITSRLQGIQAKYGHNAVGVYLGNPSIHNLGTTVNTPPFIKSLRTKNVFSATSVDQLPHHFASWLMFGHPLLMPVPDISRTNYMLILGGNPLASNGSMMTAPNVGGHLKNIQKRGGTIVVVDPRRTETAEHATEHFFINPSMDVFFLLGLIKVIFEENLMKLGKNGNYTEGVETLQAAINGFSLSEIALQTGIPTSEIRRVAREFAAAKSAVCYGRVGVSMQKFGGLCQWLINCLNILTGNFDSAGGAMFTSPAVDILANAKPRNIFNRWQSRVRGLSEFMGELPVSTLADEILTEGEGKIRAMITNCGNPILSTPNGRRLDAAFGQLDFMVSIDIYLNETTRHADFILPPATGLEMAHYDLTFNLLAIRNTAKYSPATLPKAENAKFDYEILQELTHRLTANAEKYQAQPPEIALDLGLRYGSYKLSLEQLKAQPSGVDLGELQSVLPNKLVHEDKKIQIAPPVLVADLDRVRAILSEATPQYSPLNAAEGLEDKGVKTFQRAKNLDGNKGFMLIGRRHLRDNNSWMHNSDKLMKGKNRCTLLINDDDAMALSLDNQQIVRVTSRVGSVEVAVELTKDIMRGVVSLPHGYGHNRNGVGLDVATKHAGVSINDLTDEQEIDSLTGNAAFSNVRVWLEKVFA